MYLTKLYVRFFRSFNFDYERKATSTASPPPWELVDGAWFPFIRIDLDRQVTAIVGANESGKSHLIEAVKRALSGENISRDDFCRYSALYSVETGKLREPDFGIEFAVEHEPEIELLRSIGIDASEDARTSFIRLAEAVSLLIDSSGEAHELSAAQVAKLEDLFPKPFQLYTNVALPDSISLAALQGKELTPLDERHRRYEMVDAFRTLEEPTLATVTDLAPQLFDVLARDRPQASNEALTSAALAEQLLIDVAKIDRQSFGDLEKALRTGNEGQAGGLIDRMNQSLARRLNFNRWWRQDRDFQLRLDLRERELVFLIRDRTGTDYSFRERSTGLTYFLSYFVQLKAHPRSSDTTEILLMDEPDAYLSSAGQQDLLRVLEHFARPDDAERRDQVIYVTHSPFLINKNQASRIRVLDKGSNEEGTRVVRDAANNRYEPLRSAVGSFVAETAFIGGENLLVEGAADQVLLTGLSSLLRTRGLPPRLLLDLNDVTIVPCGGADSVPYVAYLARGRDEIKPACIALLDGDQAGRDASKKLARSTDGGSGRILDSQYIVDLGVWATREQLKVPETVAVTELEDLIPPVIAVKAAEGYAQRFLGLTADEAQKLKPAHLEGQLAGVDGRIYKALELGFAEIFRGAHTDKVGFAKELVGYLDRVRDDNPRPHGMPALETNFSLLIAHLA